MNIEQYHFRDLDEVHRYLRITQSSLEIDFFNYEWYLRVFDEFKPKEIAWRQTYRMDRILPQICTAAAEVNMKHVLKQMQYRFAVIYGTLSSIGDG